MGLASVAKRFASSNVNFNVVEFASKPQGLGIKLFPQQEFLLKVFEKEELDDSRKTIEIRDQFNEEIQYILTERQFWDFLHDNGQISLTHDEYYGAEIIQFQLCMGRRSTKSTTISIYVAYKLYQLLSIYRPQEFFRILPNSEMNVTLVALGKDSAEKLFNKFLGLVKASPFFQPFMREDPIGDTLKLWTQHDISLLPANKSRPPAYSNSINVFALPNTPGVRGEDNILAIMDELAHFNQSHKSTAKDPLDAKIYEGLTPSVSGFKTVEGESFGKTCVFSSPNFKKGKFYEEYDLAFRLKLDSGALAIRAPTWHMNPNVAPSYLRSSYAKSPASYKKEYGAEFSDSGEVWIKDRGKLARAVDRRLDPHTEVGRQDRVYFLGADFAARNDGVSAAITHYERQYERVTDSFISDAFVYDAELAHELERNEGKILTYSYVLDYIDTKYPGVGEYEGHSELQIEDMLTWMESLYKRWPLRFGMFDQWAGIVIAQLVKTRGMRRFEMIAHTDVINDAQARTFSEILHTGHLVLPDFDPLLNELKILAKEDRAKNLIKVQAPRGDHDDQFDALIRSLWLCHAYVNGIPEVKAKIPHLFNKTTLVNVSGGLKGARSYKHYLKLRDRLHGGARRSLAVRRPRH